MTIAQQQRGDRRYDQVANRVTKMIQKDLNGIARVSASRRAWSRRGQATVRIFRQTDCREDTELTFDMAAI